MKKINTVGEYITRKEHWGEELLALREIILSTKLVETVKWGAPVYVSDGKNIVGLGAFKAYVGLWFFQGVFLSDKKKKLINAQEDKTKALRQWRFSNIDDIKKDGKLILAYVKEAIKNQREGKEIKPSRNKPLNIPIELEKSLKKNKRLHKSFELLSLSKQREYAEYISEAKREATKVNRMEKIAPMIIEGSGLHDKYKR